MRGLGLLVDGHILTTGVQFPGPHISRDVWKYLSVRFQKFPSRGVFFTFCKDASMIDLLLWLLWGTWAVFAGVAVRMVYQDLTRAK